MAAVAVLMADKVLIRAIHSQRRVEAVSATLTFQLTWAVGAATVLVKWQGLLSMYLAVQTR
jgi:hypothetical protein